MNARAFEIVSTADCTAAFERGQSPTLDRALPVTRASWRHIYAGRLPAATIPQDCGQPWWLDLQITDNTTTSLLWVTPDMPAFAGHFPDQPILPGVMQLHWGIQLANLIWPQYAADTAFVGTARVKFKAPVLPDTLMRLQLTRETQIKLTLSSASAELTSLWLRYRD